MDRFITIDGAGRVVIPKPIRDRLGLRAGSRLEVLEEEGQIVLRSDRPEPVLVERNGFLALDLQAAGPVTVEHTDARDERLTKLIRYALRR